MSEEHTSTVYRSNYHNAEKQKDGVYRYRWEFSVYTNKDNNSTRTLTFNTNVYNKNEELLREGNTYVITCHSNGTYDIIDDGEGFSQSDIPIGE